MNERRPSGALILYSSNSLSDVGSKPSAILSGMVSDALKLAHSQKVTRCDARFRIAGHELCEPDYRQIHIWADASSLSAEALIEKLENMSSGNLFKQLELTPSGIMTEQKKVVSFEVFEGRIISLYWNACELPIPKLEVIPGLLLERLAVYGEYWSYADLKNIEVAVQSQSLRHIYLYSTGKYDLSGAPNIELLWCEVMAFDQRCLQYVPSLTSLTCRECDVTHLDISENCRLKFIDCCDNLISELDLSASLNLEILECAGNRISHLDLSISPNLLILFCSNNPLQEVDVRNSNGIQKIYCDGNDVKMALPESQKVELCRTHPGC